MSEGLTAEEREALRVLPEGAPIPAWYAQCLLAERDALAEAARELGAALREAPIACLADWRRGCDGCDAEPVCEDTEWAARTRALLAKHKDVIR